MRICTKCNVNEITYKNPKTGHWAPYCKECRKQFDKAYAVSDKRKEALKKYNNKPDRVAHLKEYNKEYLLSEHGKEVKSTFEKKWRKQNRYTVKYCARKIAQEAKRCGLIKLAPCEVCGTEENLQMHHDDYTKPMDIRWLCKQHHDEHHKKEKAT